MNWRSLLHDLAVFGGLAAVFVGLWWERPSVALVVVGAVLFVGGCLSLPIRGNH